MLRTLVFLLTLLTYVSQAIGSDEFITDIAGKLGYEIKIPCGNESNGDGNIYYACKALPNNSDLFVVALATFNKDLTNKELIASNPSYNPDYDSGYRKYDLTVLIVKSSSGRIVGKFISLGALESDAVMLQNLHIDTGRYYLEPKHTILGVRAMRHLNSQIAASENTVLYLYQYKKNKLELILDNIEIDSCVGNNESAECATSTFERTNRTISVLKTITNGLHDIALNEKVEEETYKNYCGNEDEKSKKTIMSRKKVVMKFNGQQYVLPSKNAKK
jgi:hypothetical protein